MKAFYKSVVFVAAIIFALGFVSSAAWADDVNFTIDSYVTKVETIPLADAEGHMLMLGERRGVANFDDGKVAAYHTSYICDVSKGMGPCEGYSDLTFMDKSQAFSKWKLTVGIPEGKKMPVLKGTGSWNKGTGEYEGIEGDFSFSGYYITPYNEVTKGDQVVKVTGSYKLPPK
jgi:hypothetical protein